MAGDQVCLFPQAAIGVILDREDRSIEYVSFPTDFETLGGLENGPRNQRLERIHRDVEGIISESPGNHKADNIKQTALGHSNGEIQTNL